MSITEVLRHLIDRRVDVMIVGGDPGLRVIALTWDDHEKSRGAERLLPPNASDARLLEALEELASEVRRV